MAASEDVREALNMLQVKDKCEGVVEEIIEEDKGEVQIKEDKGEGQIREDKGEGLIKEITHDEKDVHQVNGMGEEEGAAKEAKILCVSPRKQGNIIYVVGDGPVCTKDIQKNLEAYGFTPLEAYNSRKEEEEDGAAWFSLGLQGKRATCFKEVDIGNEDGQMKKMCKEEVEKVEGNIEEGNDVEAKKEDNDDEWGPKKGQEAEEGKGDVKVEFEKYPEDKSDYGGKKPGQIRLPMMRNRRTTTKRRRW